MEHSNIKFDCVPPDKKRILSLEFDVLSVIPPEEGMPIAEFCEALVNRAKELCMDEETCTIEFNVNTYNETYSCMVFGERIETDYEYRERVQAELTQRENREKARKLHETYMQQDLETTERAEFLRLKEKYGNQL